MYRQVLRRQHAVEWRATIWDELPYIYKTRNKEQPQQQQVEEEERQQRDEERKQRQEEEGQQHERVSVSVDVKDSPTFSDHTQTMMIYTLTAILALNQVILLCLCKMMVFDLVPVVPLELDSPLCVSTYCVIGLQLVPLQVVAALAGCRQENKKLTGVLVCSLCVLLAADVAMAVLWAHELSHLDLELAARVTRVVQVEYGGRRDVTLTWDLLQQDLTCCGVTSQSDWRETYWSETVVNHTSRVPDSCCNTTSLVWTHHCTTSPDSHLVFTQGCLLQLQRLVQTNGYVLFVVGYCLVSFVKVLLLVAALGLNSRHTSDQSARSSLSQALRMFNGVHMYSV